MYRSVQQHGYSEVARQLGLYTSIDDETLAPLDHLAAATTVDISGPGNCPLMSQVVEDTVREVAPLSIAITRQRRRDAILYWEQRARELERGSDEPFHLRLVEEMDRDLDLFRRGGRRFSEPLEVAVLVRSGAHVIGSVAYDQAFARKPGPLPEPWSLQRLADFQSQNLATILRQLRGSDMGERHSIWESVHTEVSQGFGMVHLSRPPPVEVPDVFYRRFLVRATKWDSLSWDCKQRPCDNGTACGVNSALSMASHVDCSMLDCMVATALLFVRLSEESLQSGGAGYGTVVFNHDQAYRRVRRAADFRCLIPIISPGAFLDTPAGRHWIPEGDVVYLELWRLLFGAAGAVAAYCLVARTIALCRCAVLLVPTNHYVDDFLSVYKLADESVVDDLKHFVTRVLGVHFQDTKFKFGSTVLALGMEVTLSARAVRLQLHEHRRAKSVFFLQSFLSSNVLYRPEAEELGGRLSWSCAALFGRCGRAYLAPILRRAHNREAQPYLNQHLRIALQWWLDLFTVSPSYLHRSIRVQAPARVPMVISYSDASDDYGLGAVLCAVHLRCLYFFRVPIDGNEPIDRLELEAAAVSDALFGPLVASWEVSAELAFIDSNVALPWVTSGLAQRDDVDPILAGFWAQMAFRAAFKWFERVSSFSNLADAPSRGLAPLVPCGWRCVEVPDVQRWQHGRDGLRPGRPRWW